MLVRHTKLAGSALDPLLQEAVRVFSDPNRSLKGKPPLRENADQKRQADQPEHRYPSQQPNLIADRGCLGEQVHVPTEPGDRFRKTDLFTRLRHRARSASLVRWRLGVRAGLSAGAEALEVTVLIGTEENGALLIDHQDVLLGQAPQQLGVIEVHGHNQECWFLA